MTMSPLSGSSHNTAHGPTELSRDGSTRRISSVSDARLGGSSLKGMHLARIDGFEAAVPLSPEARDAYLRRYSTLFVDETRDRCGGGGVVTYACNAQGESLAIKTLRQPTQEPGEDDAAFQKRTATLVQAFRHEYENHLALNGVRGFPHLYGYGLLDGMPAIVMEWIEGVTLEQARWQLAVDDQGRLSPLVVARLGRDLFDLLARLENVGNGMVHRDLSPANIMVRTSHLSAEQQAVEGSFDLCLIDFGSSASTAPAQSSFTVAQGVVRAATANYAPPEMLTSDLPHLDKVRKSPKIDVYAAGSVLYLLLSGKVPFELDEEKNSPYRVKVDKTPARPDAAHAPGCDLARVLKAEPEVSSILGAALLDAVPSPSGEEVRQALALVDDQLIDVVMACLKVRQDERPSADALHTALTSFCACYTQNVSHALQGEPLMPCTADAAWYASTSPRALRRMIRSVGRAIASGIWLVVVVSAGLLLQGTPARLSIFGFSSSFVLTAPLVWAALAAPTLVALVARGRREGNPQNDFMRGTVVLAVLSLALGIFASAISLSAPAQNNGLFAAIFATASAGWCPLVLDYATTVVPALVRESRRRLPASGTPAPREVLPGSTAPTKVMTYINQTADPTYEVSDDAADE